MPTNEILFYDVDPMSIIPTGTGDTFTWTGPATATGSATITDTEPGIEGQTLDDDSNGNESATADVTVGGQSSTGSDADAERAWTVRDLNTGEEFQIVEFDVEDGDAAGSYTLSEKPLDPNTSYEVIAYDSNPDANSGDPVFNYADFNDGFFPQDGTVEGTSGNDMIDAAYTGDPEGDLVDGADGLADVIEAGAGDDTVIAGFGDDSIRGDAGNDTIYGDFEPGNSGTAPSEVLTWADEGADGADISAGFTQNTGEIDVTVSFRDDGDNNATFNVETTDTVYTDAGDPFDSNSNVLLFGNGDGATSTTTIDFAAASGSVTDDVENVSFRLNDIDWGIGNHTDIVTVNAYDADGNLVPVSFTLDGGDTLSGNTITADEVAEDFDEAGGSALVEIAGPVSSIEINYANGQDGTQGIWLSDVHFDTVPDVPGDDTISGGAGGDEIYGGAGNDTIEGDGTGAVGQWTYEVYDRDFTSADGQAFDIEYGTLVESGETGDFDSRGLVNGARGTTGDPDDFGVIYTSQLEASETGTHTFSTTSDDGSTIRILDGNGDPLTWDQDGTTGTFMDNDGHQAPTTNSGTVTLQAGQVYTIEVRHWENAGGEVISGSVTPPSGASEDLASSALIIGPGTTAGIDTLFGEAGDDTLDGGAGDDTLDGGTGADSLSGGEGDDSLAFAEGDTADGGDGNDTFVLEDLGEAGNGPITIDGGGTGEILGGGDTLQLGDLADLSTLSIDNTFTNASGNTSQDGSVTLDDGTVLTFDGIENIICFTPGTRIATARGAVPVEQLNKGDMVITRDHGLQPVRWIEARTVAATGALAPVRIAPRVLPGLQTELLVSPQHRVLFQGYRAELLFGQSEVLVAANHLVDDLAVSRVEGGTVTYVHFLLDQHEIVFADGTPTESFHPGSYGVGALGDPAREELFTLFPALRSDLTQYGQTARRCLKAHEARLIRD